MKIGDALREARQRLSLAGVEEASLEGDLLMRHILGMSAAQLYLNFDQELAPEKENDFRLLIQRRLCSEPAAYILGHREFYGLDYYVNQSVLIPRPETELLVEETIGLAGNYESAIIADVGTGCGAIGVALAVNLPRARIYATDISTEALMVARANARRHGVEERLVFSKGDLLEPLPESVDIVVANLPYVRSPDVAGSFEPHIALDGGSDGLAVISRFCGQLSGKVRPSGCVLLEVGLGQAEAVTEMFRGTLPDARVEVYPDLAGIERIVRTMLPVGASI